MKLTREKKAERIIFFLQTLEKGEKIYQVTFISSNHLLEHSKPEAISSINQLQIKCSAC